MLTRDARFDGRFFVAVHTTGIYCRPICPARTPKLQNVTFLPSAAAAQAAGFRPCLRCRPETSPDLAAWRGTAATVSRAMALIDGGALNNDNVDGLADRLGVGERQLRRLFHQHLGASPIAVAQTRRVLFAKQLITDTTLPMTEVALAAGFGSVRRFNDVSARCMAARRAACAGRREKTRRPRRSPSRCRSSRHTTGRQSSASSPPARSPASSRCGPTATRAASPSAAAITARTAPSSFARQTAGTPWSPPSASRSSPRCRRSSRASAACSTSPPTRPRSAPIWQRTRSWRRWSPPALACACPAPGTGSSWRCAASSASRSLSAPRPRLAGKLVALCGTPLPPADDPALAGLTHVFPAPDTVAGVTDLGLVIGMPRARAAAITALARAAAAEPRLFGPGRGLDEAIPRLCALPGIGEWTAQYIAMRALREPDAFPAADIGLMRALARDGVRPSPAQLLAHAEAWRPWRAYAALHLWASDAGAPRPATKEVPHAVARRTRAVADRHDSPGL